MATVQDIMNDVAALPDVVGVSHDSSGPITPNFTKVRIRYVFDKSAEVGDDGEFFLISENNYTLSSEAKYYRKKPDILDPPPDSGRDNYWTDEQIITNYQANNADHTVLQVRVSQSGDLDIAHLRIDDSKTTDITSKNIAIYEKGTDIVYKEMK